jgi:hypothetical protein
MHALPFGFVHKKIVLDPIDRNFAYGVELLVDPMIALAVEI